MKELLNITQPPQKGEASFFKILPDKETGKGESWNETIENQSIKSNTIYTLTDITDSAIIVDFTGNSVTITKAEMMGTETTTTMNNKSTGKIILDKTTGIIREKTIYIESNGSTEVMGGSLPVTSKTTITITVK
jgi:hypothetical protein